MISVGVDLGLVVNHGTRAFSLRWDGSRKYLGVVGYDLDYSLMPGSA